MCSDRGRGPETGDVAAVGAVTASTAVGTETPGAGATEVAAAARRGARAGPAVPRGSSAASPRAGRRPGQSLAVRRGVPRSTGKKRFSRHGQEVARQKYEEADHPAPRQISSEDYKASLDSFVQKTMLYGF